MTLRHLAALTLQTRHAMLANVRFKDNYLTFNLVPKGVKFFDLCAEKENLLFKNLRSEVSISRNKNQVASN